MDVFPWRTRAAAPRIPPSPPSLVWFGSTTCVAGAARATPRINDQALGGARLWWHRDCDRGRDRDSADRNRFACSGRLRLRPAPSHAADDGERERLRCGAARQCRREHEREVAVAVASGVVRAAVADG